jgi:hypothetical protein
MKIPEFMLCEDPQNAEVHPFIYHHESKTLLRAMSNFDQDTLGDDLEEIVDHPNYQLQYGVETFYIIAIEIDLLKTDFLEVTKKAALWYGEYLKWEDEQHEGE